MGTSKTDLFSQEINDKASIFKALGHPARLAIVAYLLEVNTCICGDIVLEIQLAQPTVSQHLKELKQAGIIKGNIEGNAICYCINEQVITELKRFFEGMLQKLDEKKSCC